jgi:hypothetical protein
MTKRKQAAITIEEFRLRLQDLLGESEGLAAKDVLEVLEEESEVLRGDIVRQKHYGE